MMSHTKIRKAVFPVAGMGTRFLPATKASPKEMLPIVDKPLIQYAVEEAIAAGCTELVFITGRSKRTIEDHFDKAYELETELHLRQKDKLLTQIQNIIPANATCTFIRQAEALGLGHAILCSEPAIGNEPFAVILADDLIDAPQGALSQLLETYNQVGSSVIGTQVIPHELTEQYGIVETLQWQKLQRIHHIVEKPKPTDTVSSLAVVGRYILTPRIFDLLRMIGRGAGGEIQLTDAIAKLLEYEPVLAQNFIGKRFDCGSKLGYLEATVAFGLKHAETSEAFKALVKHYARHGVAAAPVIAPVSQPENVVHHQHQPGENEWVAEHEEDNEDIDINSALPMNNEDVAQLVNMLSAFMSSTNADDDEDEDDEEEEAEQVAQTVSQPENTVEQVNTVAEAQPEPQMVEQAEAEHVVEAAEEQAIHHEPVADASSTETEETKAVGFQSLNNPYAFGARRYVPSNPNARPNVKP